MLQFSMKWSVMKTVHVFVLHFGIMKLNCNLIRAFPMPGSGSQGPDPIQLQPQVLPHPPFVNLVPVPAFHPVPLLSIPQMPDHSRTTGIKPEDYKFNIYYRRDSNHIRRHRISNGAPPKEWDTRYTHLCGTNQITVMKYGDHFSVFGDGIHLFRAVMPDDPQHDVPFSPEEYDHIFFNYEYTAENYSYPLREHIKFLESMAFQTNPISSVIASTQKCPDRNSLEIQSALDTFDGLALELLELIDSKLGTRHETEQVSSIHQVNEVMSKIISGTRLLEGKLDGAEESSNRNASLLQQTLADQQTALDQLNGSAVKIRAMFDSKLGKRGSPIQNFSSISQVNEFMTHMCSDATEVVGMWNSIEQSSNRNASTLKETLAEQKLALNQLNVFTVKIRAMFDSKLGNRESPFQNFSTIRQVYGFMDHMYNDTSKLIAMLNGQEAFSRKLAAFQLNIIVSLHQADKSAARLRSLLGTHRGIDDWIPLDTPIIERCNAVNDKVYENVVSLVSSHRDVVKEQARSLEQKCEMEKSRILSGKSKTLK